MRTEKNVRPAQKPVNFRQIKKTRQRVKNKTVRNFKIADFRVGKFRPLEIQRRFAERIIKKPVFYFRFQRNHPRQEIYSVFLHSGSRVSRQNAEVNAYGNKNNLQLTTNNW